MVHCRGEGILTAFIKMETSPWYIVIERFAQCLIVTYHVYFIGILFQDSLKAGSLQNGYLDLGLKFYMKEFVI